MVSVLNESMARAAGKTSQLKGKPVKKELNEKTENQPMTSVFNDSMSSATNKRVQLQEANLNESEDDSMILEYVNTI